MKIVIGTTPLADVMPAYIAREKGFFAARGLDVSFTFILINPTIPAALMANSIQIRCAEYGCVRAGVRRGTGTAIDRRLDHDAEHGRADGLRHAP